MTGPVAEHIEGLKALYGDLITRSWSANFEEDPYVGNSDLIIGESLLAIAATHPVDDQHCIFVNLVTPGDLGDPAGYLVPALEQALGDKVRLEDQGQCGCGGYVLRAWRLA